MHDRLDLSQLLVDLVVLDATGGDVPVELVAADHQHMVTFTIAFGVTGSLDTTLESGRGGSAFIATQAEIMQSRSVIADAISLDYLYQHHEGGQDVGMHSLTAEATPQIFSGILMTF